MPTNRDKPTANAMEPVPHRVLVVDDDPSQRATLDALLSASGLCEVVCAASVGEAERLLRRADFDVVVADYDMPDGTGLRLLEQVGNASPHTTGVLITGHASDTPDLTLARTHRRVFRIVLKPYDPQMFIGWVKSAIALSRMRRSGVHPVS